jgi:hypothetical protein
MNGAQTVVLEHLGWSGFRIGFPDGTEIYIDPPAGAVAPRDREANILITHGHPEHLAGTLEHLRDPARGTPALVVASAAVCRHLGKRSTRNYDDFYRCKPRQRVVVSGLRIDVFRWRHMPLLPPGFKPALQHIKRLVSHPALSSRIVAAGVRGPLPFPMLGFRIVPPDGPRVLVYGEGLHRLTGRANASRVGDDLPAEILLVAVEPEDVDVLPELINIAGATTIGLYEAHRAWRDAFDMPCADLDALAAVLEMHDKNALVFRPGTTLPISADMVDPIT